MRFFSHFLLSGCKSQTSRRFHHHDLQQRIWMCFCAQHCLLPFLSNVIDSLVPRARKLCVTHDCALSTKHFSEHALVRCTTQLTMVQNREIHFALKHESIKQPINLFFSLIIQSSKPSRGLWREQTKCSQTAKVVGTKKSSIF